MAPDETMTELMLTAAHKDLIERIGVLHDRLGFAPAPGRVVGLMLVSPKPALTFEEVRTALGLSKSSTSAALNFLMGIGSVEYFTRPGERRRYFRKSYRNWEAALIKRMDSFLALRDLLREAAEVNRGRTGHGAAELPRMIDFLEFLEVSLHEAYEQWVAERGGLTPRSEKSSKSAGPVGPDRQRMNNE
jgi:hypothetical protein